MGQEQVEPTGATTANGSVKKVSIRFYADLNDFLPPPRKEVAFSHQVDGVVSIKDMIESLGVPHPEIALILVDGESVPFSYLIRGGEQISVYPRFASLDISPIERAGPAPLTEPRFVLDTHLGRLATHLRMLGFDTLYQNDYEDDELARISSREKRMLLTRDLGLLKRSRVVHGYFVRSTAPEKQLIELLRRFDLRGWIAPFTRCARCNGLLQVVAKEEVTDRLPPQTRLYYDEFRLCKECEQLYWKGSHFDRLQEFVGRILDALER